MAKVRQHHSRIGIKDKGRQHHNGSRSHRPTNTGTEAETEGGGADTKTIEPNGGPGYRTHLYHQGVGEVGVSTPI